MCGYKCLILSGTPHDKQGNRNEYRKNKEVSLWNISTLNKSKTNMSTLDKKKTYISTLNNILKAIYKHYKNEIVLPKSNK